MAWIDAISRDEAEGPLARLYDRIKAPDGSVDNIMLAHSLRPHTLEGHMSLYKAVLHHARNVLPETYLETVGVYVSLLNRCDYCVEHHFAGLKRLLADESRAAEIRSALEDECPEAAFAGGELAGLVYAARLTRSPAAVSEDDIARLRAGGFDDGQILELNQVCAYFAYANRTVLGLGVDTDGDVLGLSPGSEDDWRHR